MDLMSIEAQCNSQKRLGYRLLAASAIVGLIALMVGCSPAPTVGITCGGKDIWCPEGMICVQDPQLGGICTVNPDASTTPSCKTDDQCKDGRICGASGTCVDPPTEYSVKLTLDNIGTTTAEFTIEASLEFQSLLFEVTDVEHRTVFSLRNNVGANNRLLPLGASALKPGTQYSAWVYLNWNGPGWQKWASSHVVFTTKEETAVSNPCDAERKRLQFESLSVYRECVNYTKSGIASGIFETYVIDEVTQNGQKHCFFHNVTMNGAIPAFQTEAESISIDDPGVGKPHWYFRSTASPQASESITECWATK